MNNEKILLVEPDFPFPNKSKHGGNSVHKNFVPIGLLKFGAMYKDKGCKKIKLIRGMQNAGEIGYVPDRILVTSLFTYWSSYVLETLEYYRKVFPKSIIELGGIYATLHIDTEELKKFARKNRIRVIRGVVAEAEKYTPDYSLIPEIDYHATHMMRGCIRRCAFCGTWKIEPKLIHKDVEQIVSELKKVGKNKVIFYDNNILANPNIKDILRAFQNLKINDKPVKFESQSGFDGRLMENDPEVAELLKKAGFKEIRIAWDNGVEDKDSIKKQIDVLLKAGYPAREISVFMIYNFNMPIEQMIEKQKWCLKWGVQTIDCRYRPLKVTSDNYNPHKFKKGQTKEDYYIHEFGNWTDKKIRIFRGINRRHSIIIRYVKDKSEDFDKRWKKYYKIKDYKKCFEYMDSEEGMGYTRKMEKWSAYHNTYKFFGLGRPIIFDEIQKSKLEKEIISKLNTLKSYYKKKKINPPILQKKNKKKLLKEIKKLVEEIKNDC